MLESLLSHLLLYLSSYDMVPLTNSRNMDWTLLKCFRHIMSCIAASIHFHNQSEKGKQFCKPQRHETFKAVARDDMI